VTTSVLVFPQRRGVLGLRALAAVATAIAGAFACVTFTGVAAAFVGWSFTQLGFPALGAGLGFLTLFPAWILAAHVVWRAIERATRIRTPWGSIAVGLEGVRWDGWLRRRLTRWRDVTAVMPAEGDAIALVTGPRSRVVLAARDGAALRAAIAAARKEYAASERAEIPPALVRDASAAVWLARVRSLLDQDGYRSASVPPDALTRVLEDPDAPALVRAGAAAALAHHAPSLPRVRVALEACVDEELALAIDEALEDRIDPARWARLR
jgi:hypothetical protein